MQCYDCDHVKKIRCGKWNKYVCLRGVNLYGHITEEDLIRKVGFGYKVLFERVLTGRCKYYKNEIHNKWIATDFRYL